jgi:hypothetical protein
MSSHIRMNDSLSDSRLYQDQDDDRQRSNLQLLVSIIDQEIKSDEYRKRIVEIEAAE